MLLTMGILVIDDSYFEPSAHIFYKKDTILPTLIIFSSHGIHKDVYQS